MLWSKLSPPNTFPKRRKVKETGRKRIERTSITPTARKIIPSRPEMSELTSDFSALFPNQSLMIALIPAYLTMKYIQQRLATKAKANVMFKSALPGRTSGLEMTK